MKYYKNIGIFQLSQLLLIVSVTPILKVFILDIGIWFGFFLAYKDLVDNNLWDFRLTNLISFSM
jgi:hypothetical protein